MIISSNHGFIISCRNFYLFILSIKSRIFYSSIDSSSLNILSLLQPHFAHEVKRANALFIINLNNKQCIKTLFICTNQNGFLKILSCIN